MRGFIGAGESAVFVDELVTLLSRLLIVDLEIEIFVGACDVQSLYGEAACHDGTRTYDITRAMTRLTTLTTTLLVIGRSWSMMYLVIQLRRRIAASAPGFRP